MYAVMFTMVHSLEDVYINANNLYMTAMMVIPMGVLMILMMPSMYKKKRLNTALLFLSFALFVSFYIFERNQTFIGDRQFLKSMIPHHSGAILMCEKSKLTDPEIITLCQDISEGQRREIEQMRQILSRLDHN
jgi:uncharacterized protein (DUF305 family)